MNLHVLAALVGTPAAKPEAIVSGQRAHLMALASLASHPVAVYCFIVPVQWDDVDEAEDEDRSSAFMEFHNCSRA